MPAVAGKRINCTKGPGIAQAGICVLVLGSDFGFPVVVQLLFQRAEHPARGPLEAIPVDIQVSGARQVQARPILGHRHAGHVGDRIDGLVLRAQGQQGVRAQVEFADAVEQLGVLLADIVEVVTVLVGRNHPPTHIAGVGQRPADVDLTAVTVPATATQGSAGGKVLLRALAHQVDGGCRVATAMQQAVGAAQDLDPFIHRHVLR
ncbi:hypothetical protein D3C85_1081000 [compost metagenome]